jgi:hypothetical protein
MATDDTAAADLQSRFAQWLRAQKGGFLHADLDMFSPADGGGGDRVVRSRRAIPAGALLLRLPQGATITTAPSSCSSPAAMFLASASSSSSGKSQLSPFLRLTMQLMAEMLARGAATSGDGEAAAASTTTTTAGDSGGLPVHASPFVAYLDTLPKQSTDCLMHWSGEELQALRGTSVDAALGGALGGGEDGGAPASAYEGSAALRRAFDEHVAPVLSERPDIWPPAAAGRALDLATAGGGGGGGKDPGAIMYALFTKAADCVQTRAFHLCADNFLTGATQEEEADGGALFLLPGVDMLNHAADAARRSTSLMRVTALSREAARRAAEAALEAKGKGGGNDGKKEYNNNDDDATLGGLEPGSFCFVMRAERPIAAGEEVLHTYGDLGDAQLLQTYGFVESRFVVQEAAGGGAGARAGTSAAAAAAASTPSPPRPAFLNPHNFALLPFAALEQSASETLADSEATLARRKRALLTAAGVLPSAAGSEAGGEFVLAADDPLPEPLLTAAHVLLLDEDEVEALEREAGSKSHSHHHHHSDKKKKKQKKKKHDEEDEEEEGGAAAAATKKLDLSELGRGLKRLLATSGKEEEDEDDEDEQDWELAQAVGVTLLRALGGCAGRYGGAEGLGRAGREVVAAAAEGDSTASARRRMAAAVVLGESACLDAAKRAAGALVMRAAAALTDDEDDDEDDSEEEEPSSQEEGRHDKKRRKAAPRAAAAGKPKVPRRGSDGRMHFGDMTAPPDSEVINSDDSEGVAGYSDDSDEEEEGEKGRGEGRRRGSKGGDKGKGKGKGKGKRPPPRVASHTFEEDAQGHVHERFGDMVGPDVDAHDLSDSEALCGEEE